jgi:hypothetical protein
LGCGPFGGLLARGELAMLSPNIPLNKSEQNYGHEIEKVISANSRYS